MGGPRLTAAEKERRAVEKAARAEKRAVREEKKILETLTYARDNWEYGVSPTDRKGWLRFATMVTKGDSGWPSLEARAICQEIVDLYGSDS